jgi:hypothetical protein
MNDTQQQQGAGSASSPAGQKAQVGYAEVMRQRFIERAEFSSPKELAVAFHEAMTGAKLGEPTLPHQKQAARFQALADIQEVKAFTTAAGAETARMYMVLDGLALRFAAQISRVDLGASQGRAAAADLERVGRLLDMVLKVTKEARLCLGASNMLAQDLRALSFGGEVNGGGAGAVGDDSPD